MDKSLGQDRSIDDGNAAAPLLAQMALLEPALHGFPVRGLLEVLQNAGPKEQANARRLVAHCLDRWIATLDDTLRHELPPPADDDDVMLRLYGRQRNARDALARLHAALVEGAGRRRM